eukprot:1162089-Pelagomonas_calceolata.AAC.1
MLLRGSLFDLDRTKAEGFRAAQRGGGGSTMQPHAADGIPYRHGLHRSRRKLLSMEVAAEKAAGSEQGSRAAGSMEGSRANLAPMEGFMDPTATAPSLEGEGGQRQVKGLRHKGARELAAAAAQSQEGRGKGRGPSRAE